jgi:hypothetical protein
MDHQQNPAFKKGTIRLANKTLCLKKGKQSHVKKAAPQGSLNNEKKSHQ